MYDGDTVEFVMRALSHGLNDREVAELVGVSRRTVSSWRRGKIPHKRIVRPSSSRWKSNAADIERMKGMRDILGMTCSSIAGVIGCCASTVVNHTARGRGGKEEGMPEQNRPVPPPADESTDALKERIRRLELENDVMREMLDVLKVGAPEPVNREKAEVVNRLRGKYAVTDLCAVVGISRATFYYALVHPRRTDPDADIRDKVVAAFTGAGGTRGYRYVKHELEAGNCPIIASEKRVRRVMAQEGLTVIYCKKKRAYSSYAGEATQAPPNLVGRDFRAGLPNFLWLTDITEFKLPDAPKVYLSPVLDCFDGNLPGWRIGLHPNSELTDGSFLDAISQREGGERTVIHDDRGIHYRSSSWIAICEEHGITRSMSAKGCCPDNAAMEGFFGRLKNEFFYYRDWRGVSAEEFMERLDAYLRYYCEQRPKESLGWMSPNEYRRSLGMAA